MVAISISHTTAAMPQMRYLVVPEQSYSQASTQSGIGLSPSISAVSVPFRLSHSA
jgi:hypothetical protein